MSTSDPTLPPRTVADLVATTGLNKDTVKAAIRTGSLPGYFVRATSDSRGRYIIPGEAFDRFVKGEWVPQHRPVFTEPIRPKAEPRPPSAADPIDPIDLVHRKAS